MQKNTNGIPFNKLKINCNINQLVDIFYQLHRELFTEGKPIIDGNINDFVAVIVNSFTDTDEEEEKPSFIDRLETFLNYRYNFRYNVVSGKLEYKATKATF
ncbi:hypothetical protein MG290_14650 (plasmid) [Flavobacterium sp. CBA20B-1]|uniref:hypothetical protein n=1 Tax=unclassified Flavobacterium TaxID=196869 RepID=UPI0022255E2E|nr:MULTISPECIES: hypothetical protein [unclassified Flavobacterium]WCM43561.1 hypothetical protein MG290_14650 [Flavobacterium sp. CBA20B-1]